MKKSELINEVIIVFYGELTTKGKNLNKFISCLHRNIVSCLKPNFPKLSYETKRDHIYIYLNGTDFNSVLKDITRIPGLLSVSHAYMIDNKLDLIKKYALQVLMDNPKDELTFKINTRRVDKTFPLHSDQVNREVATYIFKNANDKKKISVDVHKPDLGINIMIREDRTLIYGNKIKGEGGYPVGVQNKVMMLLSGGIDSPVACYRLLKRGMRIECLHFASPPYTSQEVITKLKDILEKLSFYQREIKLHIVPFTQLQKKIYNNVPTSYCITILRRMMMRVLNKIALKRRCPVAASGESIGQVASQTLESIVAIEDCLELPIIRPLATVDKLDIIEMAQHIQTYDISIRPFEDCCTIFTIKDPTTCPRISKCEEYESKFEWKDLLEECINNYETIVISRDKKEEDLSFIE